MSLSFATPARRPRGESIVPMINVVFLLLVFFLMTSRLVPPAPFEVEPPEAEGGAAETAPVLYLSPEGELGFGEARGEAAMSAWLAGREEGDPPPRLRADRAVEAREVARLLKQLAAQGVTQVALEVAR